MMTVQIAHFEDSLRRINLCTLAEAAAFHGETIQDDGQNVERFMLNVSGRSRQCFLKRMGKTQKGGESFASLLSHGRVRSKARREWENYTALSAAAIETARPIAFGEHCGLLRDYFSFIITEAAPGVALDEMLPRLATRRSRRTLLRALGRWIRRMHDAGFAFPDLFARHVFVRIEAGDYRFALIDVARLDRRASISDRLRARDLAALHASLPLLQLQPIERLALMRAYGRTSVKSILPLINKRMRVLLRREKFRNFAEPLRAAA